jgi:drug/metabolite transporter (DMT)-like permease
MSSSSHAQDSGLVTRTPIRSTVAPLAAAATAATLGGAAIVGTRFLVGHHADPLTVVLLRYGIATICILPFAMLSGARSIAMRDMPTVAGLGILYFCVHPWAFTEGLKYTTAAYGGLILSGTPLLTLLLSGALGYERITAGKFIGVTLALIGIATALIDGVLESPAKQSAWFGTILIFGSSCAGAGYNVLSRPVLRKYAALNVLAYGMAAGTIALLILAAFGGHLETAPIFDKISWATLIFIGVFGAALAYYLFSWALGKTTPTRVAVFLALNPVVAMLLGVIVLGEPITLFQVAGLILVMAGIGAVTWPNWKAGSNPTLANSECCDDGL